MLHSSAADNEERAVIMLKSIKAKPKYLPPPQEISDEEFSKYRTPSLNQLSELTGFDRRTIKKQLANLPFAAGKRGAKLYESVTALEAIYTPSGLEAARAKMALSQASLNREREMKLRRERIPIPIVLDTMNQFFGAMRAILKKAVGKTVTVELCNHIFAQFRDIPRKLKWSREP
jgi:hypothetical protein